VRFRSLLFTPADTVRRYDKALASDADVVIFDLEDAVAPGRKGEARDCISRLTDRTPARRIAIRVNGLDTPWFRADIEAAVAARADLVMLPKCGSAADLLAIDAALDASEQSAGGDTGIIALAGEDAGSLAALDYKGVTPRLAAIALGAEDLSAELGIAPRDEGGRLSPLIEHARILISLAARRAGVAAIDTPFPDFTNGERHRREANDAVALGFAGKMCIHPSQIAGLNETFQPSPVAIERARSIVAMMQGNGDRGAVQIDGKMIDKAHLHGALQLLERC
jgi:citrate lyase subunit beta / citryl-CoA lyase